MDQNDSKIAKLENEIKVLKNEVQAVLLDLRESYLNMENPFNSAANPTTVQPIVITQQAPVREPKQELPQGESQKPELVKPEKSPQAENISITGLESEIAQEKVSMPTKLHSKLNSPPVQSTEAATRKNIKLDLVAVAALTSWVEESTKKIGRERTEAVLDISEAMGNVHSDLRPILVKLIGLAPQSSVESTPRSRDYIDSLIKLNSLLGNDNREEIALLLMSLMSGDRNNG